MKNSSDRNQIDNVVLNEIIERLIKSGVSKEDAGKCYDEIRFFVEARAVLLNRVPDRDNAEVGYYGAYLEKTAKQLDIEYSSLD